MNTELIANSLRSHFLWISDGDLYGFTEWLQHVASDAEHAWHAEAVAYLNQK